MEKCGHRSVIAFSARRYFRSIVVNLTTPRQYLAPANANSPALPQTGADGPEALSIPGCLFCPRGSGTDQRPASWRFPLVLEAHNGLSASR